MLSLLYKVEAYIIKAVRQATIYGVGDGRWEARSVELDLAVTGHSPEDAELALFARIAEYVVQAERRGHVLPVIAGVDLTSGPSARTHPVPPGLRDMDLSEEEADQLDELMKRPEISMAVADERMNEIEASVLLERLR